MPHEKILLVEDEPKIAAAIQAMLKSIGYKIVETVASGEEAVLSAGRIKPDLILMDIHLKGELDGVEAARQIHQGFDIPTILITGDKNAEILDYSRKAGAIGFITKPFSAGDLQRTMETCLNYHRSVTTRVSQIIQENELYYQEYFQNALIGIFRISYDGHFFDVNPSFASLLGYDSPEEFLHSASDVKKLFADKKSHASLIQILQKQKIVRDYEFEAYRKDGTKVWLTQHTRIITGQSGEKPFFEGSIQDITRRKAAENISKTLLSRQTSLLAAIPDIIMEMDDSGTYKWANNAGYEFFGNDVIGKNADSYIDRSAGKNNELNSTYVRDGKSVYTENFQKRRDGAIRLLAWHYHPFSNHLGNVTGAIASARDITDQRKSEEALQQSRESFRLITEHIDEVFWIFDFENRVMQYSSPSFERIWGFPREHLYEDENVFKNSIHPDDRDRVLSLLSSVNGGLPFSFEYRIIQPNGSIRRIYDRIYPIQDAPGHISKLVGVTKDITEQKRAEEELSRSRNYLNQIINCIGDPVFVKDRQHRFLLVNDANCLMTGIPREDFIGSSMDKIFPKEFADSMHAQEERVFATGKPLITIDELASRNGCRRLFMSNKTLLTDDAGEVQLIGVLRDITEMKKAEKEREEMEIQLRQAQKLEAIGQLAAGIAHEINTPTQYVSDNTRFLKDEFANLTKVFAAFTGLLQAGKNGGISREHLDEVEAVVSRADLDYLLEEIPKALSQSLEGLGRISTIVRAMKEFSHPGGDEKQSIDLNHAIQNTVTVCRNEWKYVADMSLDLDPTLPQVPCLPGELNQVILNLIVNAAHAIADVLEAGTQGKGTISVSTRRMDDWVEIRIGDTGTGIPEKYREKIFTPFFTTKGVGKGTGQGLAISRSVVVGKHGGTIDYITETGKGTIFIIRLPLNPAQEGLR